MPANFISIEPTRKDIRLEMTLFDRFGPLAREAIRRTPKDFNVEKLFARFYRPTVFAGRPKMPDLNDPQIDKLIADFVNSQTMERFGADLPAFVPRFKSLPGTKGLNPCPRSPSPRNTSA